MKEYTFSIGELICAVRRLNKLTQVEFSRKAGVVQSTISKIEKDIFEDVPFSLMSNISNEFNIPLSYFQMGLLAFRKSSQLQNQVSQLYTNQGHINAKTIFHILTTLENGQKDIYKKIKLPYVYLSLSNLKYNFNLIDKLYILYKNELLDAINLNSLDFEKTNYDLTQISEYIQSNEVTDYLEQSQNSISFNLKSDLNELDELYLEVLKLDIAISLEKKINIKIQRMEKGYILELV